MNRICLLLVLVLFSSGGLLGQTASEISELAMEATSVDQMKMSAKLQIIDAKGRERNRSLTTTTGSFDGVSKTLLRFTEPADVRGTSLLIYDYENQSDDMWIYLPALRKTRRIVSSEKGKNFMGSEFTNADMALPNLSDFSFEIVGEESFEGHECWRLESVCKSDDIADENGFIKKISWIEKETFLIYKVEFYNFDEELFKVQLISDYRKDSANQLFAWWMEMRNLENGRKSVLKVIEINSETTLVESQFSPNILEQ